MKMTMVILLSFLGVDGQTSSSLEDDGIGQATFTTLYRGREENDHGHTPFILKGKEANLLYFRSAMTTSEALY